MIITFSDKHTERLFHRESVRQFRAFERKAYLLLLQLHYAAELGDIAKIPGNRLEKLKGKKQHY